MTPLEFKLSAMLWLCVGFLIGYRYHVRKVQRIIDARIKRSIESRWDPALNKLLADVSQKTINAWRFNSY